MTERKKTEELLEESEELFRTFMEHSPIYIYFKDGNLRPIRLSRNFEKMLGRPLNEILGKTMYELFPSELSRSMAEDDRKVLSERKRVEVIEELEGRIYNTIKFPVFRKGKPDILAGFTMDITEQKRAENALIESEARFKAVIENISDMIGIVDKAGKTIYDSPSVERILGYKPEDLNEQKRFDIIHPDDFADFLNIFSYEVSNPGFYVNTRYRVRHKDGSWRNIEGTAINLIDNPAVKGWLICSRDITERKQAEEALKQSENKFFKIFNSSPAAGAITVFNDDRIIEVNEAFIKLFGYTRDELIGRTTIELGLWTDPLQRESLITLFPPGGGAVRDLEFEFRAKDGRMLSTRYYADKIEIGNRPHIMSIIIDETDRKKTEESLRYSEEQYRTLVNNMQDVMYRSNINGEIIFVTPSGLRLMGYETIEEIIGLNIGRDFYNEPEQRKIFLEQLEKTGRVTNFEITLKKKDGSLLTVSTNTQYYYDKDGNILGVEGVFTDITERKRAENALIESETRFKSLIENSTDMISIINNEAKVIYDSPSVERILGYKPEETLNSDPFAYIHPEDQQELVSKVFSEFAIPDSLIKNEHRVRHKDGSWRTVELIAKNLLLNPAVKGIVVNTRDITERKRAENALIESETRFRAVIENISDMITLVDESGKIIYESPSVERVLGYRVGSLNEIERFEIVHPDDMAEFLNNFSYKFLNISSNINTQYRVRHKDGSWRNIEQTGKNLIDNPVLKCWLIVSRDITEQKRTEEALLETETRFRALVENITDMITIVDEFGKVIYESPSVIRFQRMLGYESKDELQHNAFELIHPDDRQELFTRIFSTFDKPNSIMESVHRVLHKDGSFRMVESISLNLITNPAVKGVVITSRDITERKRAENALIESETRFREVVENISDMITIVDETGKIAYESPSVERMLGYRPVPITEKERFNIIHPDDLSQFFNIFSNEILNPGYSKNILYRVRHNDGSWRIIEGTAKNLIDNPAVKGMLITSRDITERKLAEEKLRDSEDLYRSLVLISPDAVTISDLKGDFTFVSPQTARLHGYDSTEELLGKNAFELIAPEDHAKAASIVETLLTDGLFKNLEATFMRKDGSHFIGEFSAALSRDTNGLHSIVGYTRDITERKRVEKALIESEKHFRALVENITDMITIVDESGKVIYESPSVERMLGYKPEESMKGDIFPNIHPEDFSELLNKIFTVFVNPDSVIVTEFRVRHKDGSWRIVEMTAKNLIDNPVVKGVLIISRDITERKRAENVAIESEKRFRALVENITDMITIVDEFGKIIYESPSVARVLGYEFKDEMQRDAFEIVHPDDREVLLSRVLTVFTDPDAIIKFENRVRHKDGSWRTVESISINMIANPAIKGVIITSRDITERKLAEKALIESETRFRALIENIADMITVMNEEGKVTYESPSVERILGYKPEELENRADALLGIIHPDDSDQFFYTILDGLSKPASPVNTEVRIYHKDGSLRTVEIIAKNLFDNPSVKGLVINSRDITNRRMAEEDLRIRDIGIASSINGIVIVDLDGVLTYVNNSLLEMWRLEREEMIGCHLNNFFADTDIIQSVINSLKTSSRWMGELKGKRSDGSLFDIQLSCNMVFNEKGRPICVMGSLLDITMRRIIEDELEKYRENLEDLVNERTDELKKTQEKLLRQEKFSTIGKITATVSHELRNPLATIQASIFSLSERLKEKSPETIRTLDRARRNIDRCDKIIQDLLDYTRYKELELVTTDIDKWLALDLSEYKMPSDIILTQELHSGARIMIDRDRLRRCVINIIENSKQAMEHNESITYDAAWKKYITVRSHISGSRLVIQVEDNGPGIPADSLDKIFEGLYSTKATGVGLGLPFVKQTMEQHGGGIEVQSELKKGTTITLWLPLERT
jgi:PAS domain S-box-containing protein